MLELRALPAFADNYIWALVADGGAALLVDPGEVEPVIAAAARGLRPVSILLTHHHADHVGGAAALRERFGLHCIAPHDERIEAVDQRVAHGERLRIAGLDLELQVIAVPGHTRSHVAFHGAGHLFCGDTLFSLGCGRMFEGSPQQMLDSLDRLAALSPDTKVCCGHEYTVANARFALQVEPGNLALQARVREADAQRAQSLPTLPARIGDERDANPFLRVDQPAVADAIARHLGDVPADRVARFAALRAWKDGFR